MLAFQALVAAKLLDLPFVLDIRDTWEMETFTHEGRLRNRLKAFCERACVGGATRVMCVTKTLLGQLASSSGVPVNRFVFVPNGADLSLFSRRQETTIADLVFAGSPAKYRNVPGILDAISELRIFLPDVRILCLGWAGLPEEREIRTWVRDRRLDSNVVLEPSVAHRDVAVTLPRCRLGVVSIPNSPAFRAAVGAKTYEYLASGLPLACLGPEGTSELRTFVEGNKVGFFATTPKEFAERASELLLHEEARELLSDRCVTVAQQFDRRTISDSCLGEVLVPLARMD